MWTEHILLNQLTPPLAFLSANRHLNFKYFEVLDECMKKTFENPEVNASRNLGKSATSKEMLNIQRILLICLLSHSLFFWCSFYMDLHLQAPHHSPGCQGSLLAMVDGLSTHLILMTRSQGHLNLVYTRETLHLRGKDQSAYLPSATTASNGNYFHRS